jgi:uncharacterized protein (TIRG00374 family)
MTRIAAVCGGLAALAGLGWWFGWHGVVEALHHATPAGLAVYLALTVIVWCGYTARWWLVARGVGGETAPARMFGARLAGDAVGALVPSARLAGEPVRIALVRGARTPTAAAAAGVALDRLLELVGNMLAVLAYVAVFSWSRGATHAPWALALTMLVLLVMLAFPLRDLRRGRPPFGLLRRFAPQRFSARVQPWLAGLARVEQHVGEMVRAQPRRLLAGLLLTIVIELVIVAQYHALLAAFGVRLELPALLLVLLSGGLANAAPTPAGLGAMEAAQVVAVGAATGRPELGFIVGVIVRLHSLLLLAAGGAALVWLGIAPRAAARADAERVIG